MAKHPPPFRLYQLASAYYVSQALYVVTRLGIADHLAEGPRTVQELASASEAHAPSLRRVLRLVASHGVLAETEDGQFELTPVGEGLRTEAGSAAAVELFAGPTQWKTWSDLLETVKTGEPAFERVHGRGPFAYFADHPGEAGVFDAANASFTRFIAIAVAASYDFTALPRLVDVGGGEGSLLTGILTAHRGCSGVVFDQSRLEPAARSNIERAELASRCDFVGGSFFESVPSGHDGYLLKHVIHDWADEPAAQILRAVRRAIGDREARVLVVEAVYPERIEDSDTSRNAAANDCNMLVATGGRQRTEAEFRELYSSAGLRLTRVVSTTAMVSIIEAVPA